MAQDTFLFRFDNSRDNDDFMTLRRKHHGDRLYSGVAMKVGPGWIPDFIEVGVDAVAKSAELTLIELEATETPARASCRKYLPESSTAIFETFLEYLNTVLAQCKGTADARFANFDRLKKALAESSSIVVRTAAAIRTSADLLEVIPLLDQQSHPLAEVTVRNVGSQAALNLQGVRSWSRKEVNGLQRVVRILHAVLVREDYCGGRLTTFLQLRQQPFDTALGREPDLYPELRALASFKSRTQSGIRVDSQKVVAELSLLWHATPDQVRSWLNTFHPVALRFQQHLPIRDVFQQAKLVVANHEIDGQSGPRV